MYMRRNVLLSVTSTLFGNMVSVLLAFFDG